VESFWLRPAAKQNGTCGQKLEVLEKSSGRSGFILRWILLLLGDASLPTRSPQIVELGRRFQVPDNESAVLCSPKWIGFDNREAGALLTEQWLVEVLSGKHRKPVAMKDEF
jgi:hypothetical protein